MELKPLLFYFLYLHTLMETYGILIGASVIGLSYVLHQYFTRKFMFPTPKSVPFLGNIFGINFFRYTDTFKNWHAQLGDTIECFFMNFKYIDTVDPEIVKQLIYSKDRDDLYKYTFRDVMGDTSVILNDGELWKKQRPIINSNFTTQALHHMMKTKPNFVAVPGEHLISRLADIADTGKPLEMDKEFSRVSLAVIGNTVFSWDFGFSESRITDNDTPFLQELWDGMYEYNKRLKNPLRKYLNPYSIWRFSHTMGVIRNLVYDKINSRLANQNMNEQGELYTDSLATMLTATAKAGDTEAAMTYPEIVDNVITLLLAGHETTAHALSFTCFELARHPQIEKKLIDSLASLGSRAITDEDMQAGGVLQYAGWVIQEALRVHPVAPSILRKFHPGHELKGNVLNDEFNVGVTLPMLHMDERVWPDPEKFDPERFNEDIDANRNRPITSYLPFGGGPRACIGKKLALLEMKYMLATLYRHFVFRLVPDVKYDVEINVTMHETHGMPLLIERRD